MRASRAQKTLHYMFSSSDFILLVTRVHQRIIIKQESKGHVQIYILEVTQLCREWTRGSETKDGVATCSDPGNKWC